MARKPNENCLEGVACPNCGQEHRFHIAAMVMVEVTDNGTEDMGGAYEWDDSNTCQCADPNCDYTGSLREFTIDNWPEEKLAWLEQLRKEDDDEGA